MMSGFQYIQIVTQGGKSTLREHYENGTADTLKPDDLRVEIRSRGLKVFFNHDTLQEMQRCLPAVANTYVDKYKFTEALAVETEDRQQIERAIEELKIAREFVVSIGAVRKALIDRLFDQPAPRLVM
jgi:hypothetical protein